MITSLRDRWIPELNLLPANERRGAYRAAAERVRTRAWTLAGMVSSVAIVNLARPMPWLNAFGIAASLGLIALATAFLLGWFFVLQAILRAPMRHAIRTMLAEEGVAICVPCGYDLRRNVSGICPECGAAYASPLS